MSRIVSMSEVKTPNERHFIALEKAFRRGFAAALNAAHGDSALRSAEAADIAMEMVRESGNYTSYNFGYADEVSRRAKELRDG